MTVSRYVWYIYLQTWHLLHRLHSQPSRTAGVTLVEGLTHCPCAWKPQFIQNNILPTSPGQLQVLQNARKEKHYCVIDYLVCECFSTEKLINQQKKQTKTCKQTNNQTQWRRNKWWNEQLYRTTSSHWATHCTRNHSATGLVLLKSWVIYLIVLTYVLQNLWMIQAVCLQASYILSRKLKWN